ncbi:FecR family protein [Pseudomonas guariconensis]|uniref:FecR family protein n=1 Tax=Pseudomonas guariconensis TaxID=1288410 RepID=UPI0018D9592B|nr:FecR family protein [Pseudomonas guariconensis]MBH3359087.1 FecR family protein [Pseudomonas guariconensis]
MKQPGAEDVREQAAEWFARIQDAPGDTQLRARLHQWLKADPRHRQEYGLLERLWQAADNIPPQRLEALCVPEPVRHLPRRRFLQQALAAGVGAAALGLGWRGWQYTRENHSEDLQTALGERRDIELPDGSQLQLNGATRLGVRYSAGQRQVVLEAGEVMFSVAHDSARPFVVDTAQGRVTVTGTRFDVRLDRGHTRVAVEQGSVKVEGASGPSAQLTAGLGAHIDPQGQVVAPYPVDAAVVTAWRHGKLVFDNATLAEVVAEVSRYRSQPLRVAPGKAAGLRLSSTFSVDDTDALLRALPSILPVAIKTHGDGSSEIIAK